MPWIKQLVKNAHSIAWEFICITGEKKFTLEMPELRKSELLSSGQGWLLLQQNHGSNTMMSMSNSLFLINPLTKAKIKMPDVVYSSTVYYGSFSTHEGKPHCIVLLEFHHFGIRKVTIRIAYPANEVWTEHTYIYQRLTFRGCSGLVIIGQHVYCGNSTGGMIVYNMASQAWKELPSSGPIYDMSISYIMEHEGRVVKYGPIDYRSYLYGFFRYNGTDNAWERLTSDDLKDTSFFLNNRIGSCFSAWGKGLKVYTLCDQGYFYDVQVHDLMDGSKQTLDLPYPIQRPGPWVGLG